MTTTTTAPDRERTAAKRRHRDYPRLQMSTPTRLTLATTGAFAVGMGLGGAHGGRSAQLRFRAEHAHRMPTRTTDWYFYHRSKNYHAIYGGLREGLRMGARLGFWAFGMVWLEHTVDRYRGRADLISTVIASLSVSGAFSLWSKLFPSSVFLFFFWMRQKCRECPRQRRETRHDTTRKGRNKGTNADKKKRIHNELRDQIPLWGFHVSINDEDNV